MVGLYGSEWWGFDERTERENGDAKKQFLRVVADREWQIINAMKILWKNWGWHIDTIIIIK
jgi:hypothetical protein